MSKSARRNTPADVVIIGAGLHGLAAGLHLARAGLQPLILEKDYPGRHASGVNAGGVRRLGRDPAEVPLSQAAMQMWHTIGDLVDDDCGFVACGQVKVAENAAELAALQQRVSVVRDLGFDHEELIDRDELRALVPSIAPHCIGGIWCRDDGAANPFRTVTAFRRQLQALGGRICTGTEVVAIRRLGRAWHIRCAGASFEAPVLLNTAGAWGGTICAHLGEPVPLRAEAPMLMITERVGAFLAPVVGAAGRGLSFKQTEHGTLLIGGGHRGRALPQRNRADILARRLRTNAQSVAELFPSLRDVQIVRFWAGIEGVMPDGIPVIGRSGRERDVYHAFGFSAHGFQLAPIVGKVLADLVCRGSTDLPIAPFSIRRFSGAGAT